MNGDQVSEARRMLKPVSRPPPRGAWPLKDCRPEDRRARAGTQPDALDTTVTARRKVVSRLALAQVRFRLLSDAQLKLADHCSFGTYAAWVARAR